MARRRSYFPAVNQQLQQFQGTELSPPGEGTYYKSSRYAGAPANIQRQAARNLGQAWQSDLAYNVQANPRIAGALQSERIGAQYGGGGSWAGRKGYQTVYGPDGGSTVVSDKVANKMISGGVYSSTPKGGVPSATPNRIMDSVEAALPTFSSMASNQVSYDRPPSLTGIPPTIARPTSSVTPVSPPTTGTAYNFGQEVGSRIGHFAGNVALGAANMGIAGENALRPAYNFFAGAAGLRQSQPRRYFTYY